MAQAVRHSPVVQTWPPLQGALQPPQCAVSRLTSTQLELQLVMQAVLQLPVAQMGRSKLVVAGHAWQVAPQALAKSVATHSPPQALKPPAQVKPQLVPLQLGVELAGPAGQAVHEVPQLFTSLLGRHCEPQAWKPLLQVAPQTPPEQIGEPLVGALQLTHEAPHWVVLVSSTQVPPQSW